MENGDPLDTTDLAILDVALKIRSISILSNLSRRFWKIFENRDPLDIAALTEVPAGSETLPSNQEKPLWLLSNMGN